MTISKGVRPRARLGKHLAALGVAATVGVIAMGVSVTVARDVLQVGCKLARGGEAGPEGVWLCPDGTLYGIPALLIGGAVAVSTLAAYGWWQTKRLSPTEVQRLRVYGNRVAAVGGAVWGTGWAIASGPWFPVVILYAVASVVLAAAPPPRWLSQIGSLGVMLGFAWNFPWFIPSLVAEVALLMVTAVVTRDAARSSAPT